MSRRDRIWQLHRQHPTWGLTELAEHLGCSKANVCYYVRREGIPLPRRLGAQQRKTAEVVQLYREGVYVKDIAERLGVSATFVCRVAHDRGLRRIRSTPRPDIPAWVPRGLREIFRVIACYADEETAAYHVRLLKSQAMEAA